MKLFTKGLIFLFLLQFSLSTLVSAANNDNASEPIPWKLITESFGIKVYERWVKTEADQAVRERSGKMILHSTIEEVIDLISDLNRVPDWMNNVEKVEMLKCIDKKEWYQRTILDVPWPFTKQDMISHYIVKHNSGEKCGQVLILRETKLYPKQQGIERLDSFNAKWEIEQVGENKVKVTFTTSSTKPPEYPSWVQDPIVRNMFFSNLKNFKKLISNNQSS